MTRVLAVDVNNDIFLRGDGRLAISDGLSAVLGACAHAAKAQRGEMIRAVTNGIPNFNVLWDGRPNLGQFEAALRAAWLAVDGVRRVVSFNASIREGLVIYEATIETVYGEAQINATL